MGNPAHDACRAVTATAIRTGFLTRGPCEVCGAADVDAHHDDYAKPLDIRWLCRTHHQGHHREHGYADRSPGRPPRAAVASDKRLELRLTAEELTRWKRAAGERGLNVAELVRESVEASLMQ